MIDIGSIFFLSSSNIHTHGGHIVDIIVTSIEEEMYGYDFLADCSCGDVIALFEYELKIN